MTMLLHRSHLLAPSGLLVLALAACTATGSTTATESPTPSRTTAVDAADWSYVGSTGPDSWGDVSATCGTGEAQSPVDLELATATPGTSADAPLLSYAATAFSAVNNWHTVEGVPEDVTASTLTVDGTVYTLQQFHLHNPSEHSLDGEHAAMELHLVHKSSDGDVAVVAVLIQVGAENAVLREFFEKLPSTPAPGVREHEVELAQEIDLPALLPTDSAVVRYTGSLTTPPCTEGVQWTVLETPVTVSQEQYSAFAALFPDDHRPTQDLGGRTVTEIAAG
jgi:carbonic anhydrase